MAERPFRSTAHSFDKDAFARLSNNDDFRSTAYDSLSLQKALGSGVNGRVRPRKPRRDARYHRGSQLSKTIPQTWVVGLPPSGHPSGLSPNAQVLFPTYKFLEDQPVPNGADRRESQNSGKYSKKMRLRTADQAL